MVRAWVVLSALLHLGLPHLGLLNAARGQTAGEAELEDVAGALDELDAAEAPVSTAELAELLTESPTGGNHGVLLGRSGWSDEHGWDHTLRLRLSARRLAVKGRLRRDREQDVTLAGAVIYGTERWRLAAGTLGISHGFGLLVAGPGRGRSLTADGGLGTRSRGLVPWAGSDGPQVVRGVGAVGSWGAWRTEVVSGHRGSAAAAMRPTTVAQVTGGGARWQLAATVLTDPAESGLSLAGQVRRRRGDVSWEAAWRRPVGSSSALAATLAQAGWRPHRALRLEVLSGWADQGPRPVLAQKHPLYGGWAGQGVAVRGAWRAATGVGLKVLVHRGRPLDEVSAGRRKLRTLIDTQLHRTWPAGWVAAFRWRQVEEETAAWSTRFPWLPPTVTRRDSRRVVSLKAGWHGVPGRAQVLWRRLNLARTQQGVGGESGGSRSLMTLAGRLAVGRAVIVRATWTTSWGAPVDLVSAVVPFGGFVLPRHWGHWRSEQLLAVEWQAGAGQGQIAISRRLPDPSGEPDNGGQNWTAWFQGAWNW